MNTLIAEDDDITRLLLTSALRKLGHHVQEATNGREAWDAWQGGKFPFIIADWMMPDLDGLDLCRRIRAEQRMDYTYIVLVTSRSRETNYVQAVTAGVDDFITKPFEKNAFAARVRVAERILGLHANLRSANTDLDRRVGERTAALETALRAAFGRLACLEKIQIDYEKEEDSIRPENLAKIGHGHSRPR